MPEPSEIKEARNFKPSLCLLEDDEDPLGALRVTHASVYDLQLAWSELSNFFSSPVLDCSTSRKEVGVFSVIAKSYLDSRIRLKTRCCPQEHTSSVGDLSDRLSRFCTDASEVLEISGFLHEVSSTSRAGTVVQYTSLGEIHATLDEMNGVFDFSFLKCSDSAGSYRSKPREDEVV